MTPEESTTFITQEPGYNYKPLQSSGSKGDKKRAEEIWRQIFNHQTKQLTDQGYDLCDQLRISPSDLQPRGQLYFMS